MIINSIYSLVFFLGILGAGQAVVLEPPLRQHGVATFWYLLQYVQRLNTGTSVSEIHPGGRRPVSERRT